jgi:hypothetical protein
MLKQFELRKLKLNVDSPTLIQYQSILDLLKPEQSSKVSSSSGSLNTSSNDDWSDDYSDPESDIDWNQEELALGLQQLIL